MPFSPKRTTENFLTFVREQGVVTLAIGFLIGGAVSKMVTAFITDIVNPLVGLIFGADGSLKEATFTLGSAVFAWGDFLSVTIDFLVIAVIVYFAVKVLKIQDR